MLSTPVGEIPYLIKDGISGFIIETYDAKKVARKIIDIVSDDEKLDCVAKTGFALIIKKFYFREVLAKWLKVLKLVL